MFQGTVEVMESFSPHADLDWYYESGDTFYLTINEASYVNQVVTDDSGSIYQVSIPFTFSINGHLFSGPDLIFSTCVIQNSSSDSYVLTDYADQYFGNALVDDIYFALKDSTGTAFSLSAYPIYLDFPKFDSMEFILAGFYFPGDPGTYCGTFRGDMKVVPTPEPATIILLLIGIFGILARYKLIVKNSVCCF
jgi:hypothetical protein